MHLDYLSSLRLWPMDLKGADFSATFDECQGVSLPDARFGHLKREKSPRRPSLPSLPT
jgi:hypothetical protein